MTPKRDILSRLGRQREALANLGAGSWCRYWWHRVLEKTGVHRKSFILTTRFSRHPLVCRSGSSDIAVFRQIFAEREYSCLDDVEVRGLIIDCGANAGFSSTYFLNRFPACTLVAVEPDPGNFAALENNLGPYRDRVQLHRAGVWSHTGGLKISTDKYGDGSEWSRQVRECQPGETADIPAVDIGRLLADSGFDRIAVLKVDIEGAEAEVFAENYEHWIDRVDNIVIELHGDTTFGDAPAVFHRAIAGRGFTLSHSGELTVCKR